ncbi:winged helix-turn-helix transcriptional regulator [Rhodococcus sp. IEGM 1318]|uniref:winged helix-turn-helix transcriptional regulator n=1 Tax=Rhodococcus sp. IEGM 1318 TaxID=3082226 RepID=UPI0029555326|nr:winged helix-turn-helix transcriptional regulator [Rhodococcus sp. IEGM 1318]MDV8009491.1 winged helix-turn-helix transcriptional regulator [Rhodococcus sp. IEGM 1318]
MSRSRTAAPPSTPRRSVSRSCSALHLQQRDPPRYGDLREALSGIATNLLAGRLRDLETAGVIERRLSEGGNAITYALTPWGAELREPINGLIRWSTPLMIRGPEDDEFRPEWMSLALQALFTGRVPVGQTAPVNVSVADHFIQLRATPTGIDVGLPDGRDVGAVLSAEAPIVLGLAAGVLTIDAIASAVVMDGDIAALHTIFEAPRATAEL